MKKNKILFGLAALVVAFGLVFSTSAFKARVPVLYQYTSNSSDEADILDIENWQPVDENSPSCGTAGSLVCRFYFDGDMSDLQDYLENPTTTAAQINSNAESTKL
ncbi:DUF6520 family protein [Pedobacter helvus]|uniref:DUF6520 family protein n=1 Tax=Pedobacter helvus TaxID=2563444 RepID=A0ABW9JL02_9SPHI|nr:DUF6520 family protein [Pedobacter ureilyticus]